MSKKVAYRIRVGGGSGMRRTLRSVGALCLSAMAVVSIGCGSEANDGMVTVYSGREEEYIAPLIERYEKETGVEV